MGMGHRRIREEAEERTVIHQDYRVHRVHRRHRQDPWLDLRSRLGLKYVREVDRRRKNGIIQVIIIIKIVSKSKGTGKINNVKGRGGGVKGGMEYGNDGVIEQN